MSRLRELLRNGVTDIQYYMSLNKGGKGSAPAQPMVAPTAPVEETGVELDEDDPKKKLKTGVASLKIPLSTSGSTGLKV